MNTEREHPLDDSAAQGVLTFCYAQGRQVPPPPPLRVIWSTSSTSQGQGEPYDIRFWDIGKSGGRLAPMEKSIYTAEYRRLCELLRELRREAGLTQVQVAEELGAPQSFVSKYESGERRLDVVELRHVARVLGVPIRTVLERLDPTWMDGA